jgi:DNA-binding NarL/FixJ family response regulator
MTESLNPICYNRLEPDVIISDIVMPGMNGIAAEMIVLRHSCANRLRHVSTRIDRSWSGRNGIHLPQTFGAFSRVPRA